MPSKEDKTVGCISLCKCIILEHLHIGKVALIGPASDEAADTVDEPAIFILEVPAEVEVF